MYGQPCKRGPRPKPFRACSVDGCERRAWADNRYCTMHQLRVARQGSADAVGTPGRKPRAR